MKDCGTTTAASFVVVDTSHAGLTNALPASLHRSSSLGKSVIDSRHGAGQRGEPRAAAARRTDGSGGRLIDLRALVADCGGADNATQWC